jgi:ribosomal protein S18 acetylase RimI-like enzyme
VTLAAKQSWSGEISQAESAVEIASAFPLMRALRPHLIDSDSFVAQIERQMKGGYALLLARDAGAPISLAGYRLLENTIYGRFIYVDDLVVDEAVRRDGVGRALLDAVSVVGRARRCEKLVLDTGLGNSLEQRFYFRAGMLATGMHFAQPLNLENAGDTDA